MHYLDIIKKTQLISASVPCSPVFAVTGVVEPPCGVCTQCFPPCLPLSFSICSVALFSLTLSRLLGCLTPEVCHYAAWRSTQWQAMGYQLFIHPHSFIPQHPLFLPFIVIHSFSHPHVAVCGQSLLSNSLRVYLNNKNRLQPIIGQEQLCVFVNDTTVFQTNVCTLDLCVLHVCVFLGLGCVTECVTLGRDSEAVYLCEVCVCRLSKADVRSHIMGSLHRYNYIVSVGCVFLDLCSLLTSYLMILMSYCNTCTVKPHLFTPGFLNPGPRDTKGCIFFVPQN